MVLKRMTSSGDDGDDFGKQMKEKFTEAHLGAVLYVFVLLCVSGEFSLVTGLLFSESRQCSFRNAI